MTNTQRNTTVLVVLLAIIIAIGFLYKVQSKRTAADLTAKNIKLNAQIFQYNKLIQMQPKLEADFAELRLMLAQQSKVLCQTDTPAATYQYLLSILRWMGRDIDFDFARSNAETANATYNEYVLSGKAQFKDVSNFVKQLEYQRALLTVEEVSLAENPSAVSDSVMFSLIFRTHYAIDGTPMDNIQRKDVSAPHNSFSAFRPRLYDNIQEEDIDPSLIKVDKAPIIGITENKVFMRDDMGIVHILSEGDKVAYGYLYSIDPENAKVIFRLNQYGTLEDKTVYMGK